MVARSLVDIVANLEAAKKGQDPAFQEKGGGAGEIPSHQRTWKCTDPRRRTAFLLGRGFLHMSVGGRVGIPSNSQGGRVQDTSDWAPIRRLKLGTTRLILPLE